MFSGVTKMIGIFGNFQVNISGYTVTNIRVRDLTEGHTEGEGTWSGHSIESC